MMPRQAEKTKKSTYISTLAEKNAQVKTGISGRLTYS